MTENVYSFNAETKDNNATFTCKASSVANPIHKKVETVLTVNCKYCVQSSFWTIFLNLNSVYLQKQLQRPTFSRIGFEGV